MSILDMPGQTSSTSCADCQSVAGSLEVRRRRLCNDCFGKYVGSKVLKRMESYRFKPGQRPYGRKLFLPLSGGVSSLVLLQVLDAQLQRQVANRNKTAYELVLAHVVLPQQESPGAAAWRTTLQESFPSHFFLQPLALHDIFGRDDEFEGDLAHFGIRRVNDERDQDFLSRIFSSATSVTTRSDLQDIILKRVLVAAAKTQDCESILWGHSDSRLAASTLASVAKGRGGSVSASITDGPSSDGINNNYPLRDLFKSELELYASITPGSLSDLVTESNTATKAPTTIRNTSIDDLLTTYILSQGEKYPSIMANVVRTAGKLQVVDPASNARCRLCHGPLLRMADEIEQEHLCYGCTRMKQDIKNV